MDNDSPSYRKKKPSDTSKSASRSNHKHEYEPCIFKFINYSWGERCVICGRTTSKLDAAKNRELRRPESLGKPGVGLNDYLSVAEMKEKFPGVKVYEEYFEGHELKVREIFQ